MLSMTLRHQERAPKSFVASARIFGRALVSGALVGGTTLVLLVGSTQVSSAASPNDYLCVVGATSQTATVSSAFVNPLEVEISTTTCGAPTPDTSTNSVTFALVGTPSASASFDTGAIATTTGFVSVSATANDEVGSYDVIATSPATASSSSPSVTFSLTNSELSSDSMTADVATYQSTDVDTAFVLGLAVTVVDGSGNPVVALPVTFIAPTSGASGTFASGSTSSVVDTDAGGVAVAPTFYANDTPGGYVIEASLGGDTSPVAFAMANEALTTMTVSSVTPTVLSQGTEQTVTIYGSGFESGAGVSFSSPGLKATSTSFVSSEALSAEVTVSSTARVGASNVTVSNPGGSSTTGEDVFTVAPLTSVAPEPLALGFTKNSAALSGPEVAAVRRFARALSVATRVECVGYGASAKVAKARTLLVARYLRSVDPHARLVQRAVVSASANKVTLQVS
ncbi:MAG: IPT/TIG domain-containing protein [Acidimicrobiales bacterium]